MKKALYILIILSTLSCNDYLDIVPDKTQELSLLFERKNAAYTALVTCYSHIPENDHLYETFVMATDELTTPFAKEPAGTDLMKGEQQADNPILSFWSGYNQYDSNSQNSLFEGIRSCNTLIDGMLMKLSTKNFDRAVLYLNTGNYKASVVTFKNFLEKFPFSIQARS